MLPSFHVFNDILCWFPVSYLCRSHTEMGPTRKVGMEPPGEEVGFDVLEQRQAPTMSSDCFKCPYTLFLYLN